MIGLAIGLAALGFFAFRHHRRHHAWARGGCHRGWHGRHHHHGYDDDWEGGGWRGPYRVMRILGTTPGQEKVIREEADRLRERARVAHDEVHAARADLADVIRADDFDRTRFDATLGRVDAAWGQLKSAVGDSVARVHETLDTRQRERLADLLASRRGPSFGPFR